MFNSLRMRIVLILTLLIVSIMVATGSFLLNNISNFYYNEFRSQMSQVFDDMEFKNALSDIPPSEFFHANLFEFMRMYSGKLGIDSYRNFYILDGITGKPLAGSSEKQDSKLERTPNLIRAMKGEVGDTVKKSSGYLDYAYPVVIDSGRYIIYVEDSKRELSEMVWIFFAIIVQALLFGLIIAVGLSFFLSKAITNPVERITVGAQRIAAGDFSYRLEVTTKDEIGMLTQTFNTMAEFIKKSLEEIEGERNKLKTIFLYLTDGVITFSKNGKLLHINKKAMGMMNLLTAGELCFEDMFSTEADGITSAEVLGLHRDEMMMREIHRDERILRVNFARFEGDEVDGTLSSFGGIIAVIHDITEEQRFERSRREFVANVSHELRTPLTSIKSYAETVMLDKDLPDDMRDRFLGVVLSEADRMTRIVKDLLVLSRLDNNKMEWNFSTCSIDEMIQHVYDIIIIESENRHHDLILNKEDNLGDISCDRDRIQQVIINILSNAIKYTSAGGKIEFSAQRIGDTLKVMVKDNGMGIPEEDLPRLFERFYRVDKARTSGGTGLGLAISKEIIMAHNGDITIDSVLKQGTSVTITLPCHTSNK